MITLVETKCCTRCSVEKPVEDFNIGKRYAGGRQTWCRECKSAWQREQRELDPAHAALKVAVDRAMHPERFAAYDAKRPDRGIEYYARKAEAFVEHVDRRTVWERDEGVCGICSLPVLYLEMHLDHRVPLSKGGLHSYENTQASHPVCNLQKWAHHPDEYLSER